MKRKLKSLCKYIWNECKDWRTLIVFIIVFLVMSSEIWVGYIIYFISKNKWWLTIANACWAFWALPFTPFLEICIACTLGIKKLMHKKRDGK